MVGEPNAMLSSYSMQGVRERGGGGGHKFEVHSTFNFRVKGPQRMSSILVKTPYYSPWFLTRI